MKGDITISVSDWADNGLGKWRTRQATLSFEEFDQYRDPGQAILAIIATLRDKIARST